MSNKPNRKKWTLVEHLRGLGIEPEAPFHPAWPDLENHWGADFKKEGTLTPGLLDKIKAMSLPAAPLAVTLYKWAAQNDADLTPFKGTVNADLRVRQAMLQYAMARIEKAGGFFQGLDDLVRLHMEQAPLPLAMRSFLNSTFNHEVQGSNDIAVWLAPITGFLPAIGDWTSMSKLLDAHYSIDSSDVQIFNNGMSGQNHHWSKNHRIELVLAAWLGTTSRYLEMPLYNHLPNIPMENPDDVTAVFWMVASQRVDMDPHGQESKMLHAWMQENPEYGAFVQEKRGLIESLMGSDPVVCGRALHQFWSQRHDAALETPSLDGIIEA